MRTKLFKIAQAATLGIALTFTFSCSGGDDPPPPDNGGESSPSQEQYVFCKLNAGTCSQMTFSTCMELVNAGAASIVPDCNAEPPPPPSSSSAAPPPPPSSSSAPRSSSASVLRYCDYGPLVTQSNGEITGGCFPMTMGTDDEANCALWGNVVNTCPSSSSSKPSSSSSSVAVCGSVSYNPSEKFCDSRNNKIYKWVKIGTQTWMAENLAYATTDDVVCNADQSKCNIYGYLYNWAAAMAIASTYNSSSYSASAKHRGACPTGWHIPSSLEWYTLVSYAGGESLAGFKLKAESYWNGEGIGTDDYGFAALPGGYGYFDGKVATLHNVGLYGRWWTTQNDVTNAYSWSMYYDYPGVAEDYFAKTLLYSVRCVQD